MEIVAIVLFVLAVYWRTINFLVIVDDIRQLNFIKSRKKKFSFYGAGTLWVHKWSDKLNLKIDHAFTLSMHALACVLIYIAFGKNIVSLTSALLYACNPINNQTAIWLNGRRYLINVILVLCMMIFKPFGFALYPLTLKMHATALFAPLLLGWPGSPILALGFLFGWKKFKERIEQRMKSIYSDDLRHFSAKKLIVWAKIYGFYMIRLVFPGKTKMIYPDLYFWGITPAGNKDAYRINFMFFRGIACIAATVAGFFYFKGDMLYMWVFMTASIAQWCVFGFSAVQGLADRYVSIASVFMMYFVSSIIHQFAGYYALPAAACLGVYYLTSLQTTFEMYKDIHNFYDYHIFHDPMNSAARILKANWKILSGDPMTAWPIVQEGLKYNPDDFRLNLAASECSVMFRDMKGLRHFIKKCEENYYIGQKEIMSDRVQKIKDKTGISSLEKEVDLIKNKKSTLSASERKRVLNMAGACN